MTYALSTIVEQAYPATVARVRELLAEAGFGVLTEIDLKATLRAKLDVEIAPQLILGACRRSWPTAPSRPIPASRPCCRATWSSPRRLPAPGSRSSTPP